MFNQLIPLNKDTHREVRFKHNPSFQCAANLMTSPIVSSELAIVAREYPIVFPLKSESTPIALLGVQEGRNSYVNASGHWLARYIPAHIRRYPFMLADSKHAADSDQKRAFTVMIDSQYVLQNDPKDERLFNDDGTPTSVLEKIQTVLINLQRETLRTMAMVKALDDAGLLVERTLKVQPKGADKPFGLQGMRLIDTTKFNECSPETLKSLAQSGALMLIYAHLISQNNIVDGPLLKGSKPAVTSNKTGPLDTLSFN